MWSLCTGGLHIQAQQPLIYAPGDLQIMVLLKQAVLIYMVFRADLAV